MTGLGPDTADDQDIKITPAQRAYLAAFDHWLKTSWATGKTGDQNDGATVVKDACFDAMCTDASVTIPYYRDQRRSYKPAGPICTACGKPFEVERKRGRPRVRCYACRPARYSDALPQALAA